MILSSKASQLIVEALEREASECAAQARERSRDASFVAWEHRSLIEQAAEGLRERAKLATETASQILAASRVELVKVLVK